MTWISFHLLPLGHTTYKFISSVELKKVDTEMAKQKKPLAKQIEKAWTKLQKGRKDHIKRKTIEKTKK